MAARASMTELIARVRRWIGDNGPVANQTFSDDDIQNTLDGYRHTVRYAPLRPGPTLNPGALYDYLDYYSDAKHWEADEQLTWVNFTVLTPASAERIDGHWTLPQGSSPAGVYPPVYITGKYYDLWAACADLLEFWAAQLSTSAYDFSADGQSFKRSQMVSAKQQLAASYRRRAMARSVSARRTDLAGNPGHIGLSFAMGGPGDVS